MSDILCITNRALCREDFLARIERLATAHPRAILLREKDLTEAAYAALAVDVLDICRRHGTPCILHSFARVARELNCAALHLPLPLLRELSAADKAAFTTLGASCHSVADAEEAAALGCTYITAGHVFATACKAGVPARGLPFLQEVASAVDIPVYAIGGIGAENIAAVRAAGAAGTCIMSSAMTCDSPRDYLRALEEQA